MLYICLFTICYLHSLIHIFPVPTINFINDIENRSLIETDRQYVSWNAVYRRHCVLWRLFETFSSLRIMTESAVANSVFRRIIEDLNYEK
jgi:hypothetical protein